MYELDLLYIVQKIDEYVYMKNMDLSSVWTIDKNQESQHQELHSPPKALLSADDY